MFKTKRNNFPKSSIFLKVALFVGAGIIITGCGDWSLYFSSKERPPIETPLLDQQDKISEQINNKNPKDISAEINKKLAETEGSKAETEIEDEVKAMLKAEEDLEEAGTDPVKEGEASGDQTEIKKEESPATTATTTTEESTDQQSKEQTDNGLTKCVLVQKEVCQEGNTAGKVCALVRETENQKVTSEVWLEFSNACSACGSGELKSQKTSLEVVGFKEGDCPKQ
jgi:hypothetical protein